MNAPPLEVELNRADELRSRGEEAAALSLYMQLPPALVCQDRLRIGWILGRATRDLSEAQRPFLEFVAEHAMGFERRRALHVLANISWYHGELRQSEIAWRRAVDMGREAADEQWLQCLLNLALVKMSSGAYFESLVLSSRAVHGARSLGDAYSVAMGGVRRGMVYVRMGEPERARRELELSEIVAARIEEESKRSLAHATCALWSARLARSRGDALLARECLQGYLRFIRALNPVRRHKLVTMGECDLAPVQFDLEPERRLEHVERLESIVSGFGGGEQPDWLKACKWEARWLRLRFESTQVPTSQRARDVAGALLRSAPDLLERDRLIEGASALGEHFSRVLHDPASSVQAFSLAASTALRRIAEVHRSTRDFPELSAATPDDWEVLGAYRKRLMGQHEALSRAIRTQLEAGHPSLDLLESTDGRVRACAWCSRISAADGRWLPVGQFLPLEVDFEVTHGICPDCFVRGGE